jgi:hypothetical protein
MSYFDELNKKKKLDRFKNIKKSGYFRFKLLAKDHFERIIKI